MRKDTGPVTMDMAARVHGFILLAVTDDNAILHFKEFISFPFFFAQSVSAAPFLFPLFIRVNKI